MQVVSKKIDELKPYERNPRNNDNAVRYVAESIKQFGFKVPMVIDKDGVIVAGHTRYKAAKELGMKEVPCIVADDLTEEQVKAFRLADNKVSEKASWDFDLLELELSEIDGFDMGDLGFMEMPDIDWADVDDLSEETYEKPEKDMCQCPKCGHIDEKQHFVKVKGKDECELE